ncbi:hypothetical protein QFC21_005546 [Naganishia friedmannii]|uniref:Uncharacterized protein n=1 Tax=Naganishia friedmannii TaxID=89922 RepID=A0ACC2V939_9TREE|nr:hypothetical protein QFC21_005546 [Naganishia friedmannii]
MTFAIPRFPFWSDKPSSEETATANTQKDGQGDTQAGGSEGARPREGEDIDAPPAFPMLDSAQRSKVPHQQPTIATPTPLPQMEFDIVPPSPTSSSSSRTLSPPPRRQLDLSSTATPALTAATSLQTPPTTTKKPNPAIKKRQKVALAPGCSPLDWARVKSSGDPMLRAGHMMPIRVTVDELKKTYRSSSAQHNTTTDAWSAFNGKVYNITPYLRFHPGGEKELMRCAGRDGTKLFMLTHADIIGPSASGRINMLMYGI